MQHLAPPPAGLRDVMRPVAVERIGLQQGDRPVFRPEIGMQPVKPRLIVHQSPGAAALPGDERKGRDTVFQAEAVFALAGVIFTVEGVQQPDGIGMFLQASLAKTDDRLFLRFRIDLRCAEAKPDAAFFHQIGIEFLRAFAVHDIGEMRVFRRADDVTPGFGPDPHQFFVGRSSGRPKNTRGPDRPAAIVRRHAVTRPNILNRLFRIVRHGDRRVFGDALIIIADATDVLVFLGQQPQPKILRDVGVLIFVDKDVAEQVLVLFQDVRVFCEDRQIVQQQVTEISCVEGQQPLLILAVDIDRPAVGDLARIGGVDPVRRQALVLPALDDMDQHPRRPTLVVDALDFQNLLQQPDLVIGIEDGEARFQTDQFGMAAQDADAERVKRAEPQAFMRRADQRRYPVAHFPRRLVGEGNAQKLIRLRLSAMDDVRQPCGQHPGLAGSRPGQHQQRAVKRLHGFPLRLVQPVEPARRCMHRRRAGRRVRHGDIVIGQGVVAQGIVGTHLNLTGTLFHP